MAFEESTTRTKPKTQLDDLAEAEKQRAIDAYRRPFLDQLGVCVCRCHIVHPQGDAAGYRESCAHCQPS